MNIEQFIDTCTERVIACITESKILDLDSIRRSVRAELSIGLNDVLRNEETELSYKQRKLMLELENWAITRERKRQINIEIQQIADKRKSLRFQASKLTNHQHYTQLRIFLKEHGQSDLLSDFDNTIGRTEPFSKIK